MIDLRSVGAKQQAMRWYQAYFKTLVVRFVTGRLQSVLPTHDPTFIATKCHPDLPTGRFELCAQIRCFPRAINLECFVDSWLLSTAAGSVHGILRILLSQDRAKIQGMFRKLDT
jgi:hypothetical protein